MSRPNKNILNEDDAIEVIYVYGASDIYVFKCSGCENKIRSRRCDIARHSGKCKSCSPRKKPFESIYTALTRSDNFASKNSTLTYEEFLSFTRIQHCHYCSTEIRWSEFRGTDDLKRYYLDRKNSDLGYHVHNLVTCCSSCNYLKSNKFTYEEFKLLGPALQEIAVKRGYNVKS